ncbi:hypothetical protein BST26_07255 [Mycolicibacterium insubricum]|uniref:Uncharacterized protein n=2 Tax=Mycolicibacterium insubricum TaxID=444597 RepID=A0A1X0DHH4_9MYCO|nr:hypothetical protein BST26_07255 [Mycolicibacterium insubricum]
MIRMAQPDRLSALSQRVNALTGRTLPRDELVIVVGRAFEHQIDLNDDGQLRALVGGLSSTGLSTEPTGPAAPASTGQQGEPPVSHGQPAHVGYQPGYPQAYPQPGVPARMNPAMVPGHAVMPPPPNRLTRHPAAFIVAGILIVLTTIVSLVHRWAIGYRYGGTYYWHYFGGVGPTSFGVIVVWLLFAVAFALITSNAGATATRTSAAVGTGSALASAAVTLAVGWFIVLPSGLAPLLINGLSVAFAVSVLATGVTGRASFGTFGVVTGAGYSILSVLLSLLPFFGLHAATLILALLSSVFLVLFGIAVSCGRVPVKAVAATP